MSPLRILILYMLSGLICLVPLTAQANTATWQALQEGGLVILMRHSLAPGIGDPPGVRIGGVRDPAQPLQRR